MQTANPLHSLCKSLNRQDNPFLEDKPLRAHSDHSPLFIKPTSKPTLLGRRTAREAHTESAFKRVQAHVANAATVMFGEGALGDPAVKGLIETLLAPGANQRTTVLTCGGLRELARKFDALSARRALAVHAPKAEAKQAPARASSKMQSVRIHRTPETHQAPASAVNAAYDRKALLQTVRNTDAELEKLEDPLALLVADQAQASVETGIMRADEFETGSRSSDEPTGPILFHGDDPSSGYRSMPHPLAQSVLRAADAAHQPATTSAASPPPSTAWGRQLLSKVGKDLEEKLTTQFHPRQAAEIREKFETLVQIAELKCGRPSDPAAESRRDLLEVLVDKSARFIAYVMPSSEPKEAWNSVVSSFPAKSGGLSEMFVSGN